MELQQWRRLALQSIVLLAVVFVSSLGLSQRIQKQLEAGVRAEEKRQAGSQKTVPRQEKKESPTVATKALVEERSDTYIKLPKEKILSPAKVYLQNKYMDFQVVLTFQGMAAASISDRDILRVKGYHVNYGRVSGRDSVLKKLEISEQTAGDGTGNTLQVKFTLKRAYEPALFESEDAYYISLLSARQAHEKIVVVDAGHGGMDEGTSSSNRKYHEKDIALGIQDKLSKLLDKTNITVYYTRTRDERVSKKERVRLANALQADLFVSIHCNALEGGEETCGVETLYSRKKPVYGSLTNKELAALMLEQVTGNAGRKKRDTVVREGLYLVRRSKVPTTIVEVGYMTNQDDMDFMKREIGQQKIAEGIYQGIVTAVHAEEAADIAQ